MRYKATTNKPKKSTLTARTTRMLSEKFELYSSKLYAAVTANFPLSN
jgi:hypothetical protein